MRQNPLSLTANSNYKRDKLLKFVFFIRKTVSPKPKDHRLKNKILVKLGERLVKMFHLKAGMVLYALIGVHTH